SPIPFMLPNGLKEILDYAVWQSATDKHNKIPLFDKETYLHAGDKHNEINFLRLTLEELDEPLKAWLRNDDTLVALVTTDNAHAMAALRRLFFELIETDIDIPVVIARSYALRGEDEFMIHSATDAGGLFIDGL